MDAWLDFFGLFWFSPSEGSFSAFLWCIFIGISAGICAFVIISKKNAKLIDFLKEKEAFDESGAVKIDGIRNKKPVFCESIEKDGELYFYLSEKSLKKSGQIIKTAQTKPVQLILWVIAVYFVMLLIHKFVPMFFENINDYFR